MNLKNWLNWDKFIQIGFFLLYKFSKQIHILVPKFESFLKMQHEELYHDGKPYEQMISELQEYANAGDYGCYVVTIDDELVAPSTGFSLRRK